MMNAQNRLPLFDDHRRRGSLKVGDYVRTKCSAGTQIRCKAYSEPTFYLNETGRLLYLGDYITTIEPGTYLGPVEDIASNPFYVAIKVKEYWINVIDKKKNTAFATKVPMYCIREWERHGWIHN